MKIQRVIESKDKRVADRVYNILSTYKTKNNKREVEIIIIASVKEGVIEFGGCQYRPDEDSDWRIMIGDSVDQVESTQWDAVVDLIVESEFSY